MAELTIDPTALAPSPNVSPTKGIAGASISAGDLVASDGAGHIVKADANGTAPVNVAVGIAICSAPGVGQFVYYITTDSNFKIGAVVVNGTAYYLTATPGKIGLSADLTSGCSVVLVGYGKGTDHLVLHLFNTGLVL